MQKKIKKNLYGRAQSAQALFPPGFGETAQQEIKEILGNAWFPQKYLNEVILLTNKIYITHIHLISIIELLMRTQCICDLRLILLETKVHGKAAFARKCKEINWAYYLNQSMCVRIKVTSVASQAFHETALKEILSDILKNKVNKIFTGTEKGETTGIYVNLNKNKLTISLSLAGFSLYRRGFREVLSSSAPLREDLAACCIRKMMEFINPIQGSKLPTSVIIPFSGTGTFAFEYLQYYYQFPPSLFDRQYAFQTMPFFKEESFNFLLKKARESCSLTQIPAIKNVDVLCLDNSDTANLALIQNINNFKSAICKNNFNLPDEIFCLISNTMAATNFFEYDFTELNNKYLTSDIFIPLNPPYGIRLNKNQNNLVLYKKIALKLNEFSKITKERNLHLYGFILCPDEGTWSFFCKTLKYTHINTYHFMQGGLDVRVCQFYI